MFGRDTDSPRENPITVEQDGRLLVLAPHRVPIQSPEGQRCLRERHGAVRKHLDGYPTLRKYLFTDKWMEGFLAKWLAHPGTLADFSRPSFYLEPFELDSGIYPKDYLERAEAGLQFVVSKARKANRKDLIGNLREGVPPAGEFEVMLAWALSTHFGGDHVEPYPRISANDTKTADFAVFRNKKRLLIEAMILLDDRDSAQDKKSCIEHGIPGTFGHRRNEVDAKRLLRACYDKVHQRAVQEPLLLCVNQLASWPDPATGAEVVGRLLAQEIWARDSTFVGIAYFYASHLVATGFAEPRVVATGTDPVLLGEVRSALCRLIDQESLSRAVKANEEATINET